MIYPVVLKSFLKSYRPQGRGAEANQKIFSASLWES